MQLFSIFCHFLPFFCHFWLFYLFGGICISVHFKAFKYSFSCFSPLYQLFGVVSSQKNAGNIFFVILPFLGRFWLVFVIFFYIFVNFCHFSPYLVISEILQLFAIFSHFLPFFTISLTFFCPFWGIYILMRFKAFKPIFSFFSHCINF